MARLRVWLLTSLVLAGVLYGLPVHAQDPGGRISGVVRDYRGVALLGATVTVTNQATGASGRMETAADGRYAFTGLVPGAYTVSAALVGLRRMVRQNIAVAADQLVSVDFALQPLVLEAITVTAMLREQELAAVPFSIAAPTEGVLRARGVENLEAVAANVAGFSVQNLGPGQSQVAMRGVSSGQIARDQPGVKEQVGAYLDDAPISLSLFTPDLDLFDVSRVEVLRGPQGTLFGAGSEAGTVRYISNQPELGVGAVFGEAGGSQVDGGGAGSNAKLGVNVPLGDKMALRAVGYSSALPGYMDAVQPNLKVDKDVNGGSRTGGRVALRIAPHRRFSIMPRVVYQRVRMDGWNRIDDYNILANPYTTTRPAVTLGERELFTQIAEPYTDDFLLTDLNLQYDFGGARVTSITSYTHRDILVVRDGGALYASVVGATIGLPEPVYTLDAPLDDSTFSQVWTQELRLSGGGDRFRWLVGGFYSSNRRRYGQNVFVAQFEERTGIPTEGVRAPMNVLFWSALDYDLQQVAGFGEATMSLTDRLDLTAGLRYYHFDEHREQVFDGIFTNDDNGNSVVSQPGATAADGLAPRFLASYRVSDGITLNAQASRGFRLGGINDPLNEPLCTPEDLATFRGRDTWKDETAWNYEVGAKTRVFGDRASINLSAFYMDIRDLQLTVTAGSCSSRLVLNAEKARSGGAEVEITAAPSEHLDFAVSAGLNDSELRSMFTDASGQVVSGIQAGNRLPSVPRVQLSAAATYQREVGQEARVFLTASYRHIGSRFTQIGDQAAGFGTVNLEAFGPNTIGGPLTASTFTFDPELPAYDLLNVRVGVSRESWELALFVNNLTDERAYLALDQERGTLARVGYLTNQPRTAGVTLRFAY